MERAKGPRKYCEEEWEEREREVKEGKEISFDLDLAASKAAGEGEERETHHLVHSKYTESRTAKTGEERSETGRELRRAVPETKVVGRIAALAEEEVL
jgi:hypothetical protein